MSSNSHYIHVYFSGRVQGVGFRYTVLQIAKEFEVAGYVRNLHDGRVELEAQGARDELNAFLQEIRHQMVDYIRNVERTLEEAPKNGGSFRGFTIR
jgi:acylphosphatase